MIGDHQRAWARLADDLPAAPRSHLQPVIEAWARGKEPPPLPTRPGGLDPEPELWLLLRAASAGCAVARLLRPDLDPTSFSAEVLNAFGNMTDRSAAVAEDIIKALVSCDTHGGIDPTRIIRADSGDVLNGFVYSILGLAALISKATGHPPHEIVTLCFSAADGTSHPER